MSKFHVDDMPEPSNKLWLIVGAIAIFIAVAVMLGIFLVSRGDDSQEIAITTITPTAVTEEVEEATVTQVSTNTPVPTNTATPTMQPTKTAVPSIPTKIPIPPTVPPTATKVKVSTRAPSRTPAPTASPTGDINNITAVCKQNATVHNLNGGTYVGTDHYIFAGTTVKVEGRSNNRNWLYIEDDGMNGWVAASFFDTSVSVASIPLVDIDDVVTPSSPTTTSSIPSSSDIAYWQEVSSSKHSIEGGRWAVDLLVHVPTGRSYTFSEDGDLDIHYIAGGNSEHSGYTKYIVTISGMSCVGPFAGDLHVLQDGQAMEVHNEFTDETGAIFIAPPEC